MSKKFYGSLDNRLEENGTYCGKIEVGTKATIYLWSDRHSYEVIDVKDQKHVTLRRLKATRTDGNGMSDFQEYDYKSDPKGETFELKFAYGKWRRKEVSRSGDVSWHPESISFGVADEHFDFSF